jgi:hypothetical protein
MMTALEKWEMKRMPVFNTQCLDIRHGLYHVQRKAGGFILLILNAVFQQKVVYCLLIIARTNEIILKTEIRQFYDCFLFAFILR